MNSLLSEKIASQHASMTQDTEIIFPSTIGQSFLYSDFLNFVKIASKYYSNMVTFSNATLLNEETVQKYIDFAGTELMLTLHDYYKPDFERITRTNLLEQVKNNIMICAEVNARNKYPLTIYLGIYSCHDNLEMELCIKIARIRCSRKSS